MIPLALQKSPDQPLGPTFILNGASIHMEAAREHIGRISRELGIEAQIVVARSGDELTPSAARAVGEKRQRVVAGGGDGTINAVAGALARQRCRARRSADRHLEPFRQGCWHSSRPRSCRAQRLRRRSHQSGCREGRWPGIRNTLVVGRYRPAALFDACAPATDPANGQFYDNAGVPYFVNASGVATALTGGGE